VEAAALLNPAFLVLVIAAAAKAYAERANRPMDWASAFLVPPLVLHRPTRDALPRDVRTHLSTWLQRHPLVRAGFPERAADIAPFVREALRFGLRHRVLTVQEGRLGVALDAVGEPVDATDEVRACIRKASLAGRWLAVSAEHPSTPFALLGVRP
jgi:hypothetical protein